MIEVLVQLKDYVPLFIQIIQLIFIVILLLVFKKSVGTLISIIMKRIEDGGSFKAGPIELGEEIKNLEYIGQSEDNNNDLTIGVGGEEREWHRVSIYEKQRGLFLTHVLTPSNHESGYYDAYIYLIRHKSSNFHDIEETEFFFGHMWGNRIFKGMKKQNLIGVSTSAYEPFLCTCCVKFKDGESITLERYIDFEMSKVIRNV